MWLDTIRKVIRSRRTRTTDRAARPPSGRPVLEVLEGRQLLSAAPGAVATASVGGTAAIVIAAVRAQSETFRAEAGRAATGDVGVLTGVKGLAADFHNLHGTVDWGDGSDPTGATFARDRRGRIHVIGAHTFAAAGRYDVTVDVSQTPNVPPGQPNPFFAVRIATIHSRAVVRPAEGGARLTEVAGRRFTAPLGSFQFANLDLRLTASIDWGDGTHSAGAVVKTGDAFDHFDVVGAHAYGRAGTYKVHVTVTASPFGAPQLPGTSPVAAFDSTIDVKSFA